VGIIVIFSEFELLAMRINFIAYTIIIRQIAKCSLYSGSPSCGGKVVKMQGDRKGLPYMEGFMNM